jgi:GH15 family glucan-1,4-alpha-glucosidase
MSTPVTRSPFHADRRIRTPVELPHCSLSWAESLQSPEDVDDAQERIAATTSFWRSWLSQARVPDHRFRPSIERLLRVASPLGLYAEEFDVDGGRHLGNFPQAFSHLAVLDAAGRIILGKRLDELR